MASHWLRHFRERVAAQPPLARAAITFATFFVTLIIVMLLAYRVFGFDLPGEQPTQWHIVVEAACAALLVSAMGYFGIVWGNGPARRDS